jgi:leucyl/phenylalanyl-tRNA--protein transferase
MVLQMAEFRLHRSMRQHLQKFLADPACTVRTDTAFGSVIARCARTPRKGQPGTWITDQIVQGYCALHAAGHAHSVETWVEGRLVGGLYGVNLGRAFYGESMFSHITDASKIAFAHLAGFLHDAGCGIIDCQMKTSHLASLGAREISRRHFADLLAQYAGGQAIAGWGSVSRRWHPVTAA